MRFLMFGTSPIYGGTEAVIYSMLDEFHKNGLDFDYVRATDKPLAKEDWLISMGSSIYHINLRKRGRFFEYRKGIDSFFDEHAMKYDGVWINLQEPEGSYIVKSASRHGIKERILVAHSSDYCSDSGFLRRVSINLSRKPLLKYATKCIAVSKLASDFTYGKKKSGINKVIRSGIDIDRFTYSQEDRDVIRNKYGIDKEDTVLISVGRLTPQKNITFSIDVLNELKGEGRAVKLFIVGSGEALSSLVDHAKKMGALDDVIFIGAVDDASPYLSAADYFLFPSQAEGLGMVIIEAQCSGLPCFASDGPIPKDAQVTELVRWIPLRDGPLGWAMIVRETEKNRSRLNAAHCLQERKMDHVSVAQEYLDYLFR